MKHELKEMIERLKSELELLADHSNNSEYHTASLISNAASRIEQAINALEMARETLKFTV